MGSDKKNKYIAKIKKLIDFKKIDIFLRTNKGFGLPRIYLGNKKLTIEITELSSGERLKVIVTTLEREGDSLFNVNNELFIYYQYDKDANRSYDYICKFIAKIIKDRLKNNNITSWFKKIIDEENGYADGKLDIIEKFELDNSKLKLIEEIKRDLNIDFIRGFWPQTKSYSLMDKTNDKKLNLIIEFKNNQKYFLKFSVLDRKVIDNQLRAINFLKSVINTPALIDCRDYLDVATGNKTFLMLFEYIEKQGRSNEKKVKLLINEIDKLHSCDFDFNILKFPQLFNQPLLEEIKEKILNINTSLNPLHKKDQQLIIEAVNFIENQRCLTKGLCHLDLHPDNFIISKNRIYLIDFEQLKYDNIIFDIALLINKIDNLISKNKCNLFNSIYNKYFNDQKYFNNNKELLLYSSILMGYFRNKLEDFNSLNKLINSVKNLK